MAKETRRRGREIDAVVWALRHPGSIAAPAVLGTGVVELGATTTGGLVAGGVLGAVGWYRAHPATFDRLAAPRLRAFRRRWFKYVGRHWTDIMTACDLVAVNRRTDKLRVPRLVRVRTWSRHVDTLYVRMLPGQSVRRWQDQADALADALRAERVVVVRHRPQLLAIVVEHSDPFEDVVDAAPVPYDVEEVDLGALPVGELDDGSDFCVSARPGDHLLVAGASGSGKGSLLWGPLRQLAPLVRDGLARTWVIDLKGGMETSAAAPTYYRHAIDAKSAIAVLTEMRDEMRRRQAVMREANSRNWSLSPEMPLDVLVIDEMAAFTQFMDSMQRKEAYSLLSEILTQTRATGGWVAGYVQEPTKDVVPLRGLFNLRIVLRLNDAAQVDMMLGERARERGALADEIPAVPETAGVGYALAGRARAPRKFRAGLVEDRDVAELVRAVTGRAPLRALDTAPGMAADVAS